MNQFPEIEVDLPVRLQTPTEFSEALIKHQVDLRAILENSTLIDATLAVSLQDLHDYMETTENPLHEDYNGQLHPAYAMLITRAEGNAESFTIDFADLSSENCVRLCGSKMQSAQDAVLEYMKFVTRCSYISLLKDKLVKVSGESDES